MELCEICKAIRFDELPSEEEPGIPHVPDLDSLLKSAEDCSLCRVILLAASELSTIIKNERTGNHKGNPGGEVQFQNVYTMFFGYHGHDDDGIYSGGWDYTGPVYTNPQHVFPRDTNIRPWLFGSWWTLGTPQLPLQLVGFGVRLGTGPRIEDAVGNSGGQIRLRGTSFRFRAEHCSPLAAIIPGRLRATSSSSLIAFEKVQQWLKECNERHSCAPYQAPLPTRVLDLGESTHSQLITLVETKGQIQKYVALSHCWGLSHRIKTMKDTIETHKKGMLFSVLPKTFQDAIVVSRKLGVRYLWIDTLCIIQDDIKDWELESSKMGEVYANAYITIAASSSTDDSSRLFPSMEARMDKNGIGYFSSDTLSHGRPGLENAIPDIYVEKGSDHPTRIALSDSALVTFETAARRSKLFLTPE